MYLVSEPGDELPGPDGGVGTMLHAEDLSALPQFCAGPEASYDYAYGSEIAVVPMKEI